MQSAEEVRQRLQGMIGSSSSSSSSDTGSFFGGEVAIPEYMLNASSRKPDLEDVHALIARQKEHIENALKSGDGFRTKRSRAMAMISSFGMPIPKKQKGTVMGMVELQEHWCYPFLYHFAGFYNSDDVLEFLNLGLIQDPAQVSKSKARIEDLDREIQQLEQRQNDVQSLLRNTALELNQVAGQLDSIVLFKRNLAEPTALAKLFADLNEEYSAKAKANTGPLMWLRGHNFLKKLVTRKSAETVNNFVDELREKKNPSSASAPGTKASSAASVGLTFNEILQYSKTLAQFFNDRAQETSFNDWLMEWGALNSGDSLDTTTAVEALETAVSYIAFHVFNNLDYFLGKGGTGVKYVKTVTSSKPSMVTKQLQDFVDIQGVKSTTITDELAEKLREYEDIFEASHLTEVSAVETSLADLERRAELYIQSNLKEDSTKEMAKAIEAAKKGSDTYANISAIKRWVDGTENNILKPLTERAARLHSKMAVLLQKQEGATTEMLRKEIELEGLQRSLTIQVDAEKTLPFTPQVTSAIQSAVGRIKDAGLHKQLRPSIFLRPGDAMPTFAELVSLCLFQSDATRWPKVWRKVKTDEQVESQIIGLTVRFDDFVFRGNGLVRKN